MLSLLLNLISIIAFQMVLKMVSSIIVSEQNKFSVKIALIIGAILVLNSL